MATKTFEETLREAQKLGFEFCRDSLTGVTYTLDELLEILHTSESDDYDAASDGYIRFGHCIVRAVDAWNSNAEVYFLN